MIWLEIARSRLLVAWLRSRGAEIGRGVFFGWGSAVGLPKGAELVLGDGVRIDCYTDLIVFAGARMEIANGAYIGKRNILSATKSLRIGAKTMTAHQVTMIDSTHSYSDANLPIADQGMKSQPIEVGDNCWLAANVSILPGVRLGPRTIVAAHSVVNESFGGRQIVGGIPAAGIREI